MWAEWGRNKRRVFMRFSVFFKEVVPECNKRLGTFVKKHSVNHMSLNVGQRFFALRTNERRAGPTATSRRPSARCSTTTLAARARARERGCTLYRSSDDYPSAALHRDVLGRGVGRTLNPKFEAAADPTRAIPFPDTSTDVIDFKRSVVDCHDLFVGKESFN